MFWLRVDLPHFEQMGKPFGVLLLGSSLSPALGALLIPSMVFTPTYGLVDARRDFILF